MLSSHVGAGQDRLVVGPDGTGVSVAAVVFDGGGDEFSRANDGQSGAFAACGFARPLHDGRDPLDAVGSARMLTAWLAALRHTSTLSRDDRVASNAVVADLLLGRGLRLPWSLRRAIAGVGR